MQLLVFQMLRNREENEYFNQSEHKMMTVKMCDERMSTSYMDDHEKLCALGYQVGRSTGENEE